MSWPYGETVIRLRSAAELDPYSGEPASTGAVVETPIPGAAVAPGPVAEPLTVGQEARHQADVTLYFPEPVDLAASDRVRVRGADHEVIGAPALWSSPLSGWRPGLVVELRRVAG
ncbi:MAG: hypothetical protein ACRC0L_01325 [Angustibacter sp.]